MAMPREGSVGEISDGSWANCSRKHRLAGSATNFGCIVRGTREDLRMKARITIFLLIVLAAMPLAGQQDIFAPEDNLVVEGIPPIPAGLAADVAQDGDFRSAESFVAGVFATRPTFCLGKVPRRRRSQFGFFPGSGGGAVFTALIGEAFF